MSRRCLPDEGAANFLFLAALSRSWRTMAGMGEGTRVGRHEDADLWTRVNAGDAEAFEALYAAHANEIFVMCLRRTGSFQDAEDGTARTFEQLWKQRARVTCDEERGLLPWLYTVARRACRAADRKEILMAELDPSLIPTSDDIVAEQAHNQQTVRVLMFAIEALPEIDEEIARCSFLAEMTSAQISQRLGLPASTVRSRLARIRSRLELALRSKGITRDGEGRD